jgi:ribosomal protein S18 acetylase RimI-like enzyme
MGNIWQDMSVHALVRAIEANLWELGVYFGQSPQVELHDQTDMLRYATGIVSPMFNGVARTRLAPHETEAKIKETLDYFKSRELPLTWWNGPSTQPVDLGQRLEAYRFTRRADMPGMAIDLATLVERPLSLSCLTIESVENTETLRRWAHTYAVTFGFPEPTISTLYDLFASMGLGQNLPLHHYVGWLNGDPIACSSVFLGAGVAGIYNVGTLPDARGRGIGAALTLEPLYHARKIGYRIGVLHSSQMAFSMYRRIGFEEFCKIQTYVWWPETLRG